MKASRSTRSIRRRVAYGVLGFIGLGVILFAVAYLLTPVPSAQVSARERLNTYFYADGKTEIAAEGTNRVPVEIEKVPKSLQDAVISAENRSFYSDPGVSFTGTARAFWSTVSGAQVQGGSTITQQMVRNYYSGLSQERSVFRKLKEVMVSLKVGRSKSKDWIMEQYLNTIYFGRDSYGVEAASQAYYKKDVSKLTPAESAFLAAAIQQPTIYGQVTKKNQAAAEGRWRYVLDGMVKDGKLTAAQASSAKFPLPKKREVKDKYKGDTGYMVFSAKNELKRLGYSEQDLALGGLKIITTYQKPLMDAARQSVQELVPTSMPKEQRVGMVTVDSATGEVVSFYGGDDYLKNQLSSSFGSSTQIGSGFKPYVLAAALDSGMTLSDTVDGSSPMEAGQGEIKNNAGTSYGEINLVTATQNSVNTAYVRLAQEVGLDKVTKVAERFGIPRATLTKNGINTYPAFALGTIALSPMQQAAGYATFASGGIYHKPHVVKSVTGRDGKTRKFEDKGRRAVSPEVAADATYALTKVVQAGTARSSQLADRESAGKTGTTDDGASVWFNGFIPQYATSVAVFHGNPKKQFKPLEIPGYSSFGGALPATLWQSFMTKAVQGLEVKDFPEPSDSVNTYQDRPRQETRPSRPSSTPRPTEEPSQEPSPSPSVPAEEPGEEPTEKPTKPPKPDPEQPEEEDKDNQDLQPARLNATTAREP